MGSVSIAERLAVIRASNRFPEEAILQLASHLETAPEEALFRMNPLAYGEAHGLSERQAVDLFLHATHAGVLDFTWGVLCLGCGAFLNTRPGLKGLQGQHACSFCSINVAAEDDNVEVTFTVSPSVRRLRFHRLDTLDPRRDFLRMFFSPSLALRPGQAEAMMQLMVDVQILPPGQHVLSLELAPGPHLVFVPSHHLGMNLLVGEAGGAEQRMELLDSRVVPREAEVRAGRVSLEVFNRTDGPVVVAVLREPSDCSADYEVLHRSVLKPFLTGKKLVTSQVFRELFRAESIPAEGGLEFKNLTVLFTDLKGSTEMYERIGDFRAYGLVREHFDLLKDIIAERGGSMVKTIGDAVMASFAEPALALQAATAMNRSIARLGELGQQLQLKIGLHSGPCIAVELNERLDYFGQTVNIASRVQGAAAASEIVCTESVFAATGTSDVIQGAALSVLREQALLKGVDGRVTVYRMR